MELNDILRHFRGIKNVAPNRYECHCPAHDDKHPSMSLYINSGEWVQPKCFTGCSEEAILEAVGLKKSDLYIGSKPYKPKVVLETTYEYKQADGTLSYCKKRMDYEDGTKKFQFFLPDGTSGLKGIPHIPYNLSDVKKTSTVYFVEGEKCADVVSKQGYVATTLDCGANSKMSEANAKFFEGKTVIILPDNDEPGKKYAQMIKKYIPWAVIKELPGLPSKGDIYDWLEQGHTMDEINKLPETITESEMPKLSDYAPDKRQQGAVLLDIISEEQVELFLNENNAAYVEVPIERHKEIYALDSKDFELWAQRLFYAKTKKVIYKDGLTQAIAILTADTKFGHRLSCPLANRVAEKSGDFWYDLTNQDWSAIKVNSAGWSVVEDVPKLFCRYRHQMGQAMPQSGGKLSHIFQYINMTKYQMLFLCWLVSCFVPGIPHPMPIFYGEKGAAKSTTCVLLKRLIDPSVLDTLTLSKDERTLIVNLQQHYFLPFDNVSSISNETSDTLCRAITGGAVQQRKMFTNGEDCIFTFKRCIALNGINNVANRSDLLDRSILFELERVTEDRRRELQDVYRSFEADRPFLLGAIFDTLVSAINIYPNVALDGLTRMADFCRWGYAIAEAIGGYGDLFLQEYKSNQADQNTEAINADVVAFLIVELMSNQIKWEGRVSDLFNKLREEGEKHGISPSNKSMPQAPNSLSRRIKAVKSNLESAGITFEFDSKRSSGMFITLSNTVSPLPPYYVDIANTPCAAKGTGNGGSSGGINGDTTRSRTESAPKIAHDTNQNEDNDDNEDDYADVEF